MSRPRLETQGSEEDDGLDQWSVKLVVSCVEALVSHFLSVAKARKKKARGKEDTLDNWNDSLRRMMSSLNGADATGGAWWVRVAPDGDIMTRWSWHVRSGSRPLELLPVWVPCLPGGGRYEAKLISLECEVELKSD